MLKWVNTVSSENIQTIGLNGIVNFFKKTDRMRVVLIILLVIILRKVEIVPLA